MTPSIAPDELIDRYISSLQERRVSSYTCKNYKSDLNLFQAFLDSESKTIDQATEQDVRAFITHHNLENKSTKTINRRLVVLRNFYKYLMREDLIQKDPMLKITALKESKRLPHAVSSQQIKRLFELLEDASLEDRTLFEVFYGTGIRIGELAILRYKDVELEGTEPGIRINGKGDKERLVPLHENLVTLLRQYVTEQDLVKDNYLFFPDSARSLMYRIQLIRDTVEKYLRKIPGLEEATPHWLRHTFATDLLNAGTPLEIVSELMGHSNWNTTRIYTQISYRRTREMLNQRHPRAQGG